MSNDCCMICWCNDEYIDEDGERIYELGFAYSKSFGKPDEDCYHIIDLPNCKNEDDYWVALGIFLKECSKYALRIEHYQTNSDNNNYRVAIPESDGAQMVIDWVKSIDSIDITQEVV